MITHDPDWNEVLGDSPQSGVAASAVAAGPAAAAGTRSECGTAPGLFRLAIALLFVSGALVYAMMATSGQGSLIMGIAAAFAAYMAMNIGANDVANNVGPAVGAKVLTLGWALVIAAISELAGALIAGGEVVSTIRSGIINPELIPEANTFIWVMMAALLAAALWLNIASATGAPVSTTHSIVGAVLGAGMAASGPAVVNWDGMGSIAASWVVSPLMGGLIAAAFLYLMKRTITYQPDMLKAARKHVPFLVAVMAWAFSAYLLLKGLSRIWPIGFPAAAAIGLIVAVIVYFSVRGAVARSTLSVSNSKDGINSLFTVPLVFAVALLSFAHGSNDVANALGPLAAIGDVLAHGEQVAQTAPVPFWVMLLGALGISLGLALYGPRVIRTVGSQITTLDPMRAYCIAMSATLTVILASQLGLPVSTTHVAVGAVFGVGFLREYIKRKYARIMSEIDAHHPQDKPQQREAFMARFDATPIEHRGHLLAQLKRNAGSRRGSGNAAPADCIQLPQARGAELVKRSLLLRIVATWVITVPASALIAAVVFFAIRGMLLP